MLSSDTITRPHSLDLESSIYLIFLQILLLLDEFEQLSRDCLTTLQDLELQSPHRSCSDQTLRGAPTKHNLQPPSSSSQNSTHHLHSAARLHSFLSHCFIPHSNTISIRMRQQANAILTSPGNPMPASGAALFSQHPRCCSAEIRNACGLQT